MICSFELFIYYSTYAMNEEPIRVHVRGLNNTPNAHSKELGSVGPCFHEVYWVYWALWVGQIKEMSDQCCLAVVFFGTLISLPLDAW